MNPPSLEETLKIARSLTHSGFTQAKADQVVAGIEQAIADNEGRHVGPSAPGPYSDMNATYTVELKGPVDLELFDPNLAHDEIDEDPPAEEEALVHLTDEGVTTSGPVVVLDERTEP